MSIINSVSLILLWSKIERKTRKLQSIQEGYDCGNSLMGYINPRIPTLQKEIKTLWERYRELEKLRKEKLDGRNS